MTIIYATYTPKDGQERGCYFPTKKQAEKAVEAAAIWEVKAADAGQEQQAYRAVMDSADFAKVTLNNRSEICVALNDESNTAMEF
tara:strand:- start:152 stop:406 length:255 start_codon:yes stop_codon:yes gene_type:complete